MPMTEELLHHSQISTGVQGKGGKGMTAAVDGQTPDIGVQITQRREESTVVPGEVPGMPQIAVGCCKDELPVTG